MSMRGPIDAMDDQVLAHLNTGEVVTYRSGDLVNASVRAVFDSAYELAGAGEMGVVDTSPAVFVQLSDLTSDPESDEGARFFIDGVEFQINEPQKDGIGGVLLHLHKVQ